MHNVACSSLSALDTSFLVHPSVSFCCSFGYMTSVACVTLGIHQCPRTKLLLVPLDCMVLLLSCVRGNPVVSVFLACCLASYGDSWSSANFSSKLSLCQVNLPNPYVEGGFKELQYNLFPVSHISFKQWLWPFFLLTALWLIHDYKLLHVTVYQDLE